MSKAILVVEMPNSCSECPLFCGHYSDMCCGGLNNRSINYPYPDNFRQDWCPLQEPPEREESSCCFDWFEDGYAQGWNACLDEILGE
jgi:hypothetical protein